VESEKSLTQSEILEDEILARTEGTNNPSEHVPEPQNHDKNLSETSQPTWSPKSLKLRMYDVLMTHNPSETV
jgi:hypothetical protein